MTSLVSLPPHVLAKIVGFCDYNTCRDKLGLTNKFLRSFAVQHGQKRGFVFMAADETMHFHNFHFRPDRPASVNPKLSEVFKLLPPFSERNQAEIRSPVQGQINVLLQ
ncbi:hypothetical protein L596_013131 [Steinernema carpocapsae]|uniref:Uncharacterized protein n=1 Tax=Steinernema carpocapsae TaxID=34508 RepID=A0A4U5NZA7_STECR|nr:hypothetical protein L596_013131 [Steinernema carpocapsae]